MAVTVSRICGIFAPLSGLVFVWIAVYNSPWFRWTEEDLSVLGVNGSATAFFNWGMVLAGVFSLVFAIGLGNGLFLRNRLLGHIGILLLILGSVALALVGLIPRTNVIPHDIASVAFFTAIPLGIFVIGISLIKSAQLSWGIFSFAAAILMVGLHLAPWAWQEGAIPQLLSSASWSIWMVTMAIRLLLLARLT